jgi:creatinine amidohydrolase
VIAAPVRHWAAALLVALPMLAVAAPSTVMLEELTSTELRDRIAAGTTTVIVPVGATEQNGPHMVLGKHNVRVRLLAQRIAEKLGNAVVAPVMAYVPEGSIDPPAGHMRFAGTISIPEPTFEAVLDATARSLRKHGFTAIVIIGDHGGYQKILHKVADKLDREWAGKGTRVLAPPEYYRVVQTEFVQMLKAKGHGAAAIGSHAGLSDTALALAIEPSLVRTDALAEAAKAGLREGVSGDPRAATAELGRPGIERIVEATVAAVREHTRRP